MVQTRRHNEGVGAALGPESKSGWQRIETAPRDGVDGVDPLILIGHIRKGYVLWAVAARWSVAMYGYTSCASRSGWSVDYMPRLASGADRPKPSGEWLMPDQEVIPTHWMPLPDALARPDDGDAA